MAKKARLSGDERRESIVASAIPLFARKGFNGVTTRELAEAAGVSEALMYRHFPSKESLYLEIHQACFREKAEDIEIFAALESGTESLVFCVWLMFSRIIHGNIKADGTFDATFPRLMVNSLLEDGEFARLFLRHSATIWRTKVNECIDAARQVGDLEGIPDEEHVRSWLIHHIAATIVLFQLPPEPVVDYEAAKEELVDQAMRFALRGLGLTPAAIARYYHPEELARRLAL